jgi:hypothetical protein
MSDHSMHPDDIVGHEETDAEIAPLVRFAIFLTVITLITAAITVGFYQYLDSREQANKAPRYPLAAGVDRPLPPPPRLQTFPFDDVKVHRREDEKLLEHYQWVDKNAGTVRIPIERAMDILAARGLPHRATAPETEAPGASPSDASGGTAQDPAQQGATPAPATPTPPPAPAPHE